MIHVQHITIVVLAVLTLLLTTTLMASNSDEGSIYNVDAEYLNINFESYNPPLYFTQGNLTLNGAKCRFTSPTNHPPRDAQWIQMKIRRGDSSNQQNDSSNHPTIIQTIRMDTSCPANRRQAWIIHTQDSKLVALSSNHGGITWCMGKSKYSRQVRFFVAPPPAQPTRIPYTLTTPNPKSQSQNTTKKDDRPLWKKYWWVIAIGIVFVLISSIIAPEEEENAKS